MLPEKSLCLHNYSEFLANDTAEPKKTNAQKSPFPCNVKSFSKVDSRDNAFCSNVSDDVKKTCESDDASDEITIICNIIYTQNS